MSQTVLLQPHQARDLLTRMVAHVSEKGDLPPTIQSRFVGRGRGNHGLYGNPFTHNARTTGQWIVPTAADAKEAYRLWITAPENRELLAQAMRELKGKVLLTHDQRMNETEPPCHAEVLVRLCNPALAAAELVVPVKRDIGSPTEFRGWIEDNQLQAAPRVLIAGSREFTNKALVERVVAQLPPNAVLIQGEAQGADTLAAEAARARGHAVAGFPADWGFTTDPKKAAKFRRPMKSKRGAWYDAAAGGMRNETMAKCQPSTVYVMSLTPGTEDMAMRAFNRGTPVVLVEDTGELRRFKLHETKPPTAPENGVVIGSLA